MIEVARLELCRELYELSGWNGTDKLWVETANSDSLWPNDGQFDLDDAGVAPAYSLGYLLRKLPQGTEIKKRINTKFEPDAVEDFSAMLPVDSGYLALDYTPEDAAALLAIELHGQGIIK